MPSSQPADSMDRHCDEHVFDGGPQNRGAVVRVGNTVRRPRGAGDVVVEALLVHLEQVGFDGSPRFLGIDDQGRQVLEFLDGSTHRTPPWQHDDAANAVELGRLAAWLRRLHDATTDFVPPDGARPRRPLPLAGEVWTHGDVGYSNVVYRDRHLVGLIDWEFAAPADRCCDPAALLAVSIRGPRPDVEDNTRRAAAAKLAAAAIADGYGMSHEEVRSLPAMAAAVLDDARRFRAGSISDDERLRSAWRSRWLRNNADYLIEP
jgi:aminoglycoside phosphotransferase (APT) family kinase protein